MSEFTLRGTITDPNQRPVARVAVRAFDRDLPSLNRDQLLGEAITDGEGRYEIAFDAERFGASEHERADLYIEVLGANREPLGRSPTRFNAEPDERIDLTIGARDDRPLSEYEALMALLLPVVEPLSFAELKAEDHDFLVQDTGADRRHVAWIAASARLSRRTGVPAVPAEAFYGWARRPNPLPDEWMRVPDTRDERELEELLRRILARLIATSPRELREALLEAIDREIIPRHLRGRIDEIIRDLIRSPLVRRQAIGRLRHEDSGTPVAGIVVRTLDRQARDEGDGDAGVDEIGRDTTNEDGLFVIPFMTPSADEDADPDEAAVRELRLEALDAAGAVIWSADVRVKANQSEILEFRVPLGRAPEPESHGLEQLAKTVQIDLPPDVLPFLASREIRTLADIRRAGGLRRVTDLPVDADDPAMRTLDAHADLARLSPDVTSNAALIQKGFTSVAGIAATPLPTFVTAAHETLGDFQAARLQVMAHAQDTFLKNVLTGLAIDRANGFARPPAIDPADPGAPAAIPDPLPERCGCDDCEAAVSPAAYLADLLGYAATHLKENGKPTTLAYLEKTFHQPFGDLPTDCEAVHEHVRQVRICIEVLRSYIAAHPPTPAAITALEAATREYLLSAYALLLVRFGTSYEEIRLARGAPDDQRRALADRLGIALTEPRPDPSTTPGDELDQLFLDAEAVPPDSHALTETALERLFGLVDTTREPLSDGVKIGDAVAAPEFAQWRIAGAIWAHNTDEDGLVHLRVQNFVTSQLVSEMEIYRDSARTILVASGKASVLSGNRRVKLSPKNASGLSGSITVSGASADNTDVSVALIPKLLVWRLRYLRTIWSRQDFPDDVYAAGHVPVNERLPLIDPDVIGPDDFRRPDPTHAYFALWIARRKWVDTQLQQLAAVTKTVVVDGQTLTVPDLDKIFAALYVPVTYNATSIAAWQAATPVTQFDALTGTLTSGTTADVAAATTRIAGDLGLSVDAFAQVVRTRSKQREWETNPKSEKVQADEWRALFSLLVQARKARFFPTWIAEEGASAMRLGPEDFWRSLREPTAGEWPPVAVTGEPLIDPDLLKLTDLPDPTAGSEARQLWKARHDSLIAETAAIRNERETNGFDAMLRRALGHPAAGNPLQHNIDAIRTDSPAPHPPP